MTLIHSPVGRPADAHRMPRETKSTVGIAWTLATLSRGRLLQDPVSSLQKYRGRGPLDPWAQFSFPWHTVGAPVAYHGRYVCKFTVGVPTDSIRVSPLLRERATGSFVVFSSIKIGDLIVSR